MAAAVIQAVALLEPEIQALVTILIRHIHKKKNPAAAVAKAQVAVDSEPDTYDDTTSEYAG